MKLKNIKSYFKTHKTFFTFIFIVITTLIIFDICYYNSPFGSDVGPINSDGEGYWAYLPAIFIHHTAFFSEIPNFHMPYVFYNVASNGVLIDMYPIGVAILEFPFFILSHLITVITALYPADGYSLFYQIAVIISGLFYLSLGFFISYLLIYPKFGKKNAIITLCIFLFCTNFFHISTIYISMGHIYSFFIISLFLFLVLNEEKFKNIKWYSFILGVVSGIISLVKSVNVLVLLIYVFYKTEDYSSFKDRFKKIFSSQRLKYNIIGVMLPISLQIVYWYKASGKIFLNSYTGYNFDYFLNPKVLSVLFGSTKGLFFYAPILLLIFFGIKLYKKCYKDIFYPSIAFLCITTYLISSWCVWSQGDSFGSRMHIDYFIFFMLMFSCALDYVLKNKLYKKIFIIFALMCFVYTNFLYFMYIVKALPSEMGLNSFKDIFSFRYISDNCIARVKYINNKKYILQSDYTNKLPYLIYPKGNYRVRIEGKNLSKGVYFIYTTPNDAIYNPVFNYKSDSEFTINFRLLKDVREMFFIPAVPENKKIKPKNIIIENDEKNFNVLIEFEKYNSIYPNSNPYNWYDKPWLR